MGHPREGARAQDEDGDAGRAARCAPLPARERLAEERDTEQFTSGFMKYPRLASMMRPLFTAQIADEVRGDERRRDREDLQSSAAKWRGERAGPAARYEQRGEQLERPDHAMGEDLERRDVLQRLEVEGQEAPQEGTQRARKPSPAGALGSRGGRESRGAHPRHRPPRGLHFRRG